MTTKGQERGRSLPFEQWGHGGVPALFLHGFTGNRSAFRHLEPLLGSTVRATCVDLPGHGEAPAPTGFLETVDQLAEMLDAPTVIVGYSQGARLALALAVRHPHKVDRLVLESGSPGLRRRHDRAQRRQADELMASLILEHGVDSFVTKWEMNPLFAGLQKLPAVEREALHSRRSAHSAAGLAAALRCLGQGSQPDYWPALIKILRPTLVLSGALDSKYTRIARRMVTDLPLGWRHTFRGSGHAPHLECPAEYAHELISFLAPAWRSEPSELVP